MYICFSYCLFDCVCRRPGPGGPGLHGGVPGGARLAVPGGGRGRRAPLPEPSLHSAPGRLHRHPAAPGHTRVSPLALARIIFYLNLN